MQARFAPKRTGFTLVELLVVISIISMLIALLLPALAKSREEAKKIQCLANIRAVTAGCLAYSVDNKEWGPPSTYSTAYRWHSARTTSYTETQSTTGDTYPPVQGTDHYFGYDSSTPLADKFYFRTKGCPNYGASFGDNIAFGGNHMILGMAHTGGLTARDFWIRLDDSRMKPAQIGMFYETYEGQTNNLHHIVNGTRPNSPYRWKIRHEGGLNWSFVDGHAKFSRMNPDKSYEGVTTRVTPNNPGRDI